MTALDRQIAALAGAVIVLDELGATELADAVHTWLVERLAQRDALHALHGTAHAAPAEAA